MCEDGILIESNVFDFVAEFRSQDSSRLKIERMVDGHHLTLTHQLFDQVVGFDAHALGQFTDGYNIGNPDFTLDRFRLRDFCLFGRSVSFTALTVALVAIGLVNLSFILATWTACLRTGASSLTAPLLFLFRTPLFF